MVRRIYLEFVKDHVAKFHDSGAGEGFHVQKSVSSGELGSFLYYLKFGGCHFVLGRIVGSEMYGSLFFFGNHFSFG